MEPPNDSLASLVEERRRRDELWRAVLDDSNYLFSPIQDDTPIDPAGRVENQFLCDHCSEYFTTS